MSAELIPADRMAVTIAEVARLTTLSRGSVRNHVRSGRIKAVKIGRRVLVPVTSLERLLQEGTRS
jgi:excisionase family DNA binding protein